MQNQVEELDQENNDYVAEKVFAAQVDLLFDQLPVAVIGSLAVVSCVAFMLVGLIPNTTLLIWYLAFSIVTMACGLLLVRHKNAQDKNYRYCANIYFVSALLGGLLVGIVPVIVINAPVEIQSFILFVIAGLCAGGLSTHAPLVKVFIAFLIPTTVMPGVCFLCQDNQYHLIGGTVLLLFALLMAYSCRNYANTLANALKLQFSNEMLSAHLADARDAAESAYKAKSVFLSSMSHELRTPMNAILGFAQLVESDESNSLNKEQTEYIDQLKKAGWHLLSLINGVLDLAKLEAEKMEAFPAHVCIGEVVNECVMIVSPIAKQSGIVVNDKASDCNIKVFVDYMHLKQVIINLLSNGIKYNRKGGSLTLEAPEIRNDVCYLAIKDTGIGLSRHQMSEIFLPFNRVAEQSSKTEGTGIGLNITCNLLDLMGGRIGVESEEGVGSTFWIEVPLTEQSNK